VANRSTISYHLQGDYTNKYKKSQALSKGGAFIMPETDLKEVMIHGI
jgi:hypothetical protein